MGDLFRPLLEHVNGPFRSRHGGLVRVARRWRLGGSGVDEKATEANYA